MFLLIGSYEVNYIFYVSKFLNKILKDLLN